MSAVDFLRPVTRAEALDAKAQDPDATPIAGGTDVMVEINMDHRRPTTLLDPPDISPNEGNSLD